jgi:hypothetical protein
MTDDDAVLRRVLHGLFDECFNDLSVPETKADCALWIAAGAGALAVGALLLAAGGLCLAQILLSEGE